MAYTLRDNKGNAIREKGEGHSKEWGHSTGKMIAKHKEHGLHVEKGSAKHKALKKRAYTGHYQEGGDGKVRHQSPKQVEKKGLNTY